MKITERDFKEYFPSNNRFLHFCAKYYGYSFYSDEVVESAAHHSLLNVMRMYNREQEFESEVEKNGMIMSSFRYGILAAYDEIRRKDRLPTKNDSQLTYGVGDEEYSKYLNSAVSHDKDHDNLYELLHKFIDEELTHPERLVIRDNILEGKTYSHISSMNDIPVTSLRSARERGLNKLRKYVKAITSTEHTKDRTPNQRKYFSHSRSKLQIETLLESISKKQAETNRYSEALSFLHPDE
jgi:RNA polymerase sigma factor (sigma-70 family)